MNKALVAIVAVVLLLGVGAGGYYLGKNSVESPETNSTASTSDGESEEKVKEDTNSVDVASILTGIESEYETVTETKVFTEANDPNGNLGKQGSYVDGGAFWDTRTDYSNEYSDEPETWGTDAGGSIEVYASEEDAIKRAEYFSNFDQGSFISPGAYKQVSNVVLRASSNYPKSTQDEVISLMESLL